MESHFKLQCYHSNLVLEQPHLFVQSHGLHAGRPLKHPIPNCFVVLLNAAEDQAFYFTLIDILFQSNCFKPFLVGSVIPFLRIKDVKSLIIETLARAKQRPELFRKAVSVAELTGESITRLTAQIELLNRLKLVHFAQALKN